MPGIKHFLIYNIMKHNLIIINNRGKSYKYNHIRDFIYEIYDKMIKGIIY